MSLLLLVSLNLPSFLLSIPDTMFSGSCVELGQALAMQKHLRTSSQEEEPESSGEEDSDDKAPKPGDGRRDQDA